MSKLSLSDPSTMDDEEDFLAVIEANNTATEEALEKTLFRDGTSPNEMEADLDMNSNRILNLPTPASSSEPATKGYADSIAALADAAALAAAVADAETAQAAAEAAQAAAEDAVANYTATSVTNITPSVASKAFTIAAGKSFTAGDWVLIKSDAAPTTVYMHGQVTTYVTTTLTVDVQTIGTATESADWSIYISSPKGTTGTTGAAGADYTADDSLTGLKDATLSTTGGIIAQTDGASSPRTFSPRTITGTSNLITVTDGNGVSGNPTLTVGSNVVRKDSTGILAVGYTHTVYDHGTLSGTVSITPLPSLGFLQKASIAASAVVTVAAPTAEEGACMLLLTNSGAPTSVTFTSFDKTLTGSTFSLSAGKVHLVFIYSLNTYQIINIQTIV